MVKALPAGSVAVLAVLIVSSCTDSSGEPTTDTAAESAYPAGVSCVSPPPAAVDPRSDLSLSVIPNPVKAAALATLELGNEGLGPEPHTGAGVVW